MLFNSITFILVFFPIVLAIYFISPVRIRNVMLLLASLFFYAWGEPVYIGLMMISILFNYFSGLDIYQKINKDKKNVAKNSLILAIVVNLAILGFFKYYGFLINILNGIFSADIGIRNLPLPIGISFYTFQAISYLVDIYKKDVIAGRNIIKFGLYISMFPSLVAGPIIRYNDIEEQLTKRIVTWDKFGKGLMLFIMGLGKKVILADSAGAVFAQVIALDLGGFSTLTAWVGVFAFAFQIYFDFSGYSDMAIGLAKMFGFELLPNFNYPYTATSITDFWRRWHISLSTWFRDYVYIPLGGNRGTVPKHIINLLIVWGLTGLWHGGAWHFIFWGLYFGVILILENHVWGKHLARLPKFVGQIYALFVVMIGWVFFFSPNIGHAITYLQAMFGVGVSGFIDHQGLFLISSNALFFLFMILGSSTLGHLGIQNIIKAFPNPVLKKLVVSIIYIGIFLISLGFLVTYGYTPFLYFRF